MAKKLSRKKRRLQSNGDRDQLGSSSSPDPNPSTSIKIDEKKFVAPKDARMRKFLRGRNLPIAFGTSYAWIVGVDQPREFLQALGYKA